MGTENTGGKLNVPAGLGRSVGGVAGRASQQYQEIEQLRTLDAQRQASERRAQDIRSAETNRSARVSREVPAAAPALRGSTSMARPVGGARGSVWGK